MSYKKTHFAASLLLLLLSLQVCAQTILALPKSSPETEGVSSEGIIKFLDSAGKSKHEFHSFMFLRHGKVIAEGWWKPYRPDLKHTMYSVSKSFTSTAIGFAVSEKLLTVSDKVIYFFPEHLPDTVSQYLSELTIQDLLSMSAGQTPDPTFAAISGTGNWVKAFLATPIINKPGTKFLYNTLATYMLGAIIEKVSGEKLVNYLKPRLFDPLGIQGMDWEIDPVGTNVGGWGLRIRTEDMARFGQLYLQKGNWNGKQLLSPEWIEEATGFKIDQAPDMPQAQKDSSDWTQGYCYQFWRSRNNSYRADGAYGQFILVMPEQDAVIILTAETPDMQDEINLVWKYLLPAIRKDKLPVSKNSAILQTKLSSLHLPIPAKTDLQGLTKNITGKRFIIEPNEKHIESISFRFKDNIWQVEIKDDTARYKLAFGSGSWKTGETSKLGPSLVTVAKGHFVGLPPSKVAGAWSWKKANELELVLRYIDSPHTETMICRFDQNKISVSILHSNDERKKIVLQGESKK